MGRRGIGVCSFTVGVPPEDLVERVDAYRRGQADCETPVGKVRNERVATFTMAHVADTNERAFDEAAESMTWYPTKGVHMFRDCAQWMEGLREGDLGTYSYMELAKELGDEVVSFDYIKESGAALVGDPDRCIEIAKRYEKAGCDLLLCLFNPYKMRHEAVMRSIELVGKHLIPELDRG
jgi:alkanesulfonate monooxygenase SsuD/methylene tetrahydromethanopterin reductase-like flavin-dependent oxidoreductase (luciferase family)